MSHSTYFGGGAPRAPIHSVFSSLSSIEKKTLIRMDGDDVNGTLKLVSLLVCVGPFCTAFVSSRILRSLSARRPMRPKYDATPHDAPMASAPQNSWAIFARFLRMRLVAPIIIRRANRPISRVPHVGPAVRPTLPIQILFFSSVRIFPPPRTYARDRS